MSKILILIVIVSILSLLSRNRFAINNKNGLNVSRINLYEFFMITVLSLLIGLRTSYNDTSQYIIEFKNAEPINVFLTDVSNFNILKNPLFKLYTCGMNSLFHNYHLYFWFAGIFISASFVCLFHKISNYNEYPLVMYTFIALGTYLFSLAAMKQTIAMAWLCWALLALLERKTFRFILFVILAGLFHTYAFVFIVMLFFTGNPWNLRMFITIVLVGVLMYNFDSAFTAILDYGETIGKSVSDESLFSGASMSIMRVFVYILPPISAFFFRRLIDPQMDRKDDILMNMCFITSMFMVLATINGANLFGRMARYFEIGTIYIYVWLIGHLFNERSKAIVTILYVSLFFGFLSFGYHDFNINYKAISIFEMFSAY